MSEQTIAAIAQQVTDLDRHFTAEMKSLGERLDASDKALRDHVQMQVSQVSNALEASRRENTLTSQAQERAVTKAFSAAEALAATHNDLIRAQEKKDSTYALRTDVERLTGWQNRITGGLVLLSIAVSANFIHVWFPG
jgi:hypothetical protein